MQMSKIKFREFTIRKKYNHELNMSSSNLNSQIKHEGTE